MFNISRENTGLTAKWWRNVDKPVLFLFMFLFLFSKIIRFAPHADCDRSLTNPNIMKSIKLATF